MSPKLKVESKEIAIDPEYLDVVLKEKITYIKKFEYDYAFLSNFFDSIVYIDGIDAKGNPDKKNQIECPTVEHAFQALKSLDKKTRIKIASLEFPNQAKRMGADVALRKDWEQVKYQLMYDLVYQKFSSNSTLRKKLLNTGNAILVEGNTWHDTWFGVCTCKHCGGTGTNYLGKILMMVREQLSHELRMKHMTKNYFTSKDISMKTK